MMKLILSLGLVLVTSQTTVAQAARRIATTTTTTTTTAVSRQSTEAQLTVSVGPAVVVLPNSGETGIGTNFTFAGRAFDTTPLYLGLDLGLTFWGNFNSGKDEAGNPASKTGLSILPMAYYEFNQGRVVRPYVGIAAGPYLNFGQARTDAYFTLYFKPGVNFAFNNKVGLGVESKFGTLSDALVWAPQVTVNFAF